MKKIIGILGVAVLSATMFFANNSNNCNGINLSDLINVSSANAEVVCEIKNRKGDVIESCSTARTNCTMSKLGYTLTCTNSKLD